MKALRERLETERLINDCTLGPSTGKCELVGTLGQKGQQDSAQCQRWLLKGLVR